MLRVTAWTVGLFGAGTAISRTFASGWTEPLVLIALGLIFLFVSRQGGTSATAAPRVARQERALPAPATAHRAQAPAVAASVQPIALRPPPSAVPVPVEQSA